MTKLFLLTAAAILFLVAGSGLGEPTKGPPIPWEIPKTATIEIVLVNTPGINDEGSRWEIAYEFRIASEAALWQVWKERQLGTVRAERVGELIKEGGVKKDLVFPENRKILFQIPLSPEIQERLRNQPRDLVETSPGKASPEAIKLSREQEMMSQVFLFHPIISVYDAKLKKTIMIQYPQAWGFASHLQARFQIKVDIHDDGSYSVNTSLPTKARSN
ncbi:MAG: hypothetical protein QOJ88_645 [Pyrinomonadaceae bacterium]|jgi:hypothetical protein|nr:hypothetical protein [Pyrinomonadaceae bacterium]